MKNDEYINDEIIIDDDKSLASDIDSLQKTIVEIEGVENKHKGREVEVVDV